MLEWNMICRDGRARTPKSVRGVSLIEVLVTVVVLSIGLLGLAGLQASGTKFNHSAYMRSQAVNLAYDMADRMRANRTEALADNYNIGIGAAPPGGATVRHQDLQQWKGRMAGLLPAGDGSVTALGNGRFQIEVRWDNSRLQNEAALDSVVVRTQL